MTWFRRLNLAALLLCFAVIVIGAYVRLSDAGLGCPDWPGCYGHLVVPEQAHDVAAAQQRFPARPLEAHKAWKEMFHRYLASALGLLIVILALWSRWLPGAPGRLPWFLVALVIFQGVLGMWTVTWQLKPLAVSAHLLGGMSTLALLLWLWLDLGRRLAARAAAGGDAPAHEHRSERQAWFELQKSEAPAPSADRPRLARTVAAGLLALAAAQIFLGGWTSSNYAALACPDFPTCQHQWLPELDAREAFTLWRGLGVNYEYGVLDNRARVTIHFFHRLGALAVAAAVLLAGFLLLRRPGAALWRHLGAALVIAVTLQLALGVSIVVLQLPLALAAGHNAGAAVLLACVVAFNFFAWNPPRQSV